MDKVSVQMEDKIAEVSAFHEQEEALKAQYENAKRSLNDEAQQMQESASEINRLTEQFIECLPGIEGCVGCKAACVDL